MTDRTAVIAQMAWLARENDRQRDANGTGNAVRYRRESEFIVEVPYIDAAIAFYAATERQVRAAYGPTSKPLVTHDLSEGLGDERPEAA